MDGLNDNVVSDILNENDETNNKQKSVKSEAMVDLSGNNALIVEISDALSEKDKVKFTIHTKTNNPAFQKTSLIVVRQHEEFVWLHDRFEENPLYIGFIIPPAPPRPDFDASREKLQKLGEGEGMMTKEEFAKMKQELEAEYLATFKKTVAMHEVFLIRLANHPVFKHDDTFRIFLEYDQELGVRGKNKMEKLGGLLSSVSLTTDEYLLNTKVKDISEFFENEKTFLISYYNHLKDATGKADKMTRKHKDVADSLYMIHNGIYQLSTLDHRDLEKFLTKIADTFEKVRKLEARVASDEDLKLSDTLRYYMRDSYAAKRLLQRRLRFLADYENANRNLDKVRTRNKDVHAAAEVMEAEIAQQKACDMFEQISDKSKEELVNFKLRRVADFRKNLVDLAELEIKHGTAQIQLLKKCLASLKEDEE